MSVPSKGKGAVKVISYLSYNVDVLLDFRTLLLLEWELSPTDSYA